MTCRPCSLGHAAVLTLVALAACVSGIWGALALWFRLPAHAAARAAAAMTWGVLGAGLWLVAWWLHSPWPLAVDALMHAALLAWWLSLRPTQASDWADDVARQCTGETQGTDVLLHAVRDFHWRSDTDFEAHWLTACYAPDRLVSVDAVLSQWGIGAVAHAMLSFGFDDSRQLVFSVEIRKRRGQAFSSLGGFFKAFETILVAATERDVIRVRSNVRGETLQLYPLTIDAATRRALFLAYVRAANALAARPAFYNTLSSNCTSMVHRMARELAPGLPWDISLLLTGYLPGYLYRIGALDHRLSLAQWRARADITAKARACRDAADFSRAIRAAP